MRRIAEVLRVRSPEECFTVRRLNGAAYLVALFCFGIAGAVLGLAWRVLTG
jgi:hypothetical protein